MDIDNGGASAPADTGSVPIENIPQAPVAIDTSGPERQEVPIEPEKPSSSVAEAIKKAEAKIEAKAGETKDVKLDAKPDPKAEAKEPQPRENGKFAPKEPVQPVADQKPAIDAKQVGEPPARFSDDAKAIWKDTPEPIRRESERAIRELTQGIEKHRQEAETYRHERVKLEPFHEMAKQAGTTVEAALKEYTDLDKLLHTDKLKGLERIFDRIGISPRDYAAHVLNQSPDQQASQSDATIRELKQEIAGLKEQVGGVTQTFQQQREQSTLQEVKQFADANPRFEELHEHIVEEMKHGYTLQEAYSRAERLNPAPVRQAPQPDPVIPEPAEAHTRGQKSITGAPSASSSLAARKPSPSVRAALASALARAS